MSEQNRNKNKQLDLERYVPALITYLANKLSSGASQHYRSEFGVGVVEWRVMALLAVEPAITANRVCKVIGLDKAAVSRAIKSLDSAALITSEKSDKDARQILLNLSATGREKHDAILDVALAREARLLDVLSVDEREQLIVMLQKLNEQIPKVNG